MAVIRAEASGTRQMLMKKLDFSSRKGDKSLYFVLKICTAEMEQRLSIFRVLAALPEKPNSIRRTFMVPHDQVCNCSSRGSDTLF